MDLEYSSITSRAVCVAPLFQGASVTRAATHDPGSTLLNNQGIGFLGMGRTGGTSSYIYEINGNSSNMDGFFFAAAGAFATITDLLGGIFIGVSHAPGTMVPTTVCLETCQHLEMLAMTRHAPRL